MCRKYLQIFVSRFATRACMQNWFQKAFDHSQKTQAELAEVLHARYAKEWTSKRMAEGKIGKLRKGEQTGAPVEMVQFSEATGYPLPTSVDGEVNWLDMVRRALTGAKLLGASDSDLLSAAFEVVPVSVVPVSERLQFQYLIKQITLEGMLDGDGRSVAEVLDSFLALPDSA